MCLSLYLSRYHTIACVFIPAAALICTHKPLADSGDTERSCCCYCCCGRRCDGDDEWCVCVSVVSAPALFEGDVLGWRAGVCMLYVGVCVCFCVLEHSGGLMRCDDCAQQRTANSLFVLGLAVFGAV